VRSAAYRRHIGGIVELGRKIDRPHGRTVIVPLPLQGSRSPESSAFGEKLAGNPSGVTVPQGSVKFPAGNSIGKFLRSPRVAAVTCGFSRGVSGNALLWPGGSWLESDSSVASAIWTIRTCRSRRAAGMFGFLSARALSGQAASLILTRICSDFQMESFWHDEPAIGDGCEAAESAIGADAKAAPCGLFSGRPKKSREGQVPRAAGGAAKPGPGAGLIFS
jgi:hypothetical protein